VNGETRSKRWPSKGILRLNIARARAAEQPVLGRDAFAKISEVEGIRLTDDMKQAFAEFDRQGLSPAERRRAIIRRFK
jgi:hypothetical protein